MPDQNLIVDELVNKTFRELAAAAKPQARSRISSSPNGYIHLVAWSNASLLRTIVRKFTDTLPKSEYRTKTQIDDAARSTVANIEEGNAAPRRKSILIFLGLARQVWLRLKATSKGYGKMVFSRPNSDRLSVPWASTWEIGTKPLKNPLFPNRPLKEFIGL